MTWSVSSGFNNEVESDNPTIVREFKFTISGSGSTDLTDKVLDFGSISRQNDKVVTGDMSIRVSNADQFWNILQTDKTNFFNEGTLRLGLDVNGSTEYLTLFTGNLTKLTNTTKTKASLTFRDKMYNLTRLKMGDVSSGVTFTGSDWNPADMFWDIAVAWGGLSSITSTSNPDIDYSSWEIWKETLATSELTLQAQFDGTVVSEALQKLAEISDSVIAVEGDGRIRTYKFLPNLVTNVVSYVDSTLRKEIKRTINLKNLVNVVYVFHGYNPDNGTWAGNVWQVSTTSINSYGNFKRVFDDNLIWHSTSKSAFQFLQHYFPAFRDPIEEITFETVLKGTLNQLGDTITVTNAVLSYSAEPFKIIGIDIDMRKGLVTLDAIEDYDANNWFFLDDSTLGLLDKTYNPLY
jgi:hypothetical protein